MELEDRRKNPRGNCIALGVVHPDQAGIAPQQLRQVIHRMM